MSDLSSTQVSRRQAVRSRRRAVVVLLPKVVAAVVVAVVVQEAAGGRGVDEDRQQTRFIGCGLASPKVETAPGPSTRTIYFF